MKNSLLISIVLLFTWTAEAQNAPSASAKKSEKKIKIDFGSDELIQGDYDRPEFDMINSRQAPMFKKMIKVRDHFADEIEKTKDDFNAK